MVYCHFDCGSHGHRNGNIDSLNLDGNIGNLDLDNLIFHHNINQHAAAVLNINVNLCVDHFVIHNIRNLDLDRISSLPYAPELR